MKTDSEGWKRRAIHLQGLAHSCARRRDWRRQSRSCAPETGQRGLRAAPGPAPGAPGSGAFPPTSTPECAWGHWRFPAHRDSESRGAAESSLGVVTAMPPTRLRVTLFTGFFSPVVESTGEMPLPTPERPPPGMSLSSKHCSCISTPIKFYCIFRFSLRWESLRT